MNGGVLDFHDNGIYLFDNGHFLTNNISGGTIRTAAGFRGDITNFNPSGGTIELYGSLDADIGHGSGSNFFDVMINKVSREQTSDQTVTEFDRNSNETRLIRDNNIEVLTDLHLDGDLLIDAGTLNLNAHTVEVDDDVDIYGTLQMNSSSDYLVVNDEVNWYSGSSDNIDEGKIFLGGNWLFENGTNAQLVSPNTVYFMGNVSTFIYCMDADAEFGDVYVDKPSLGAWLHTSSTEDMHVTGLMTVTANDVFAVQSEELLVDGVLDIEDTAEMYIYSGGLLTNYSDFTLNGLLDVGAGDALIHGEFELAATGNLTIDGGSFISDAPLSRGWQSLYGTLNLSDGLFEITNNHIYIENSFIENVSGGTIRTGGTFKADNLNTFQPDGGTLEFTALTSGKYVHCSDGNYLYDMLVNTANVFSLHFDLIIQNDLTIKAGTLGSNGNDIEIGGDWTNNVGAAGFTEGSETVTFFGNQAADITNGETFYNLV